MKKKELNDYLKRKDIVIENNIATWNIKAYGEHQGTYAGQFRFKCFLTPTEKLAAGREYRALLGPNIALALKHEDNIAFSLTQLKYRIVKSPPFWSSAVGIDGYEGDIADEGIIDIVLQAAIDSELKYAALLQKKKEDALGKAKNAAEKIASDIESEEEEEEEGE